MWRVNTCDPSLKLLNDMHTHKHNIWKEHLGAHWGHRRNTHILWKTIYGLSNRAPPHTLNSSITFNNKITTTPKKNANCFTKQFRNTVKHCQTPPNTQHTGQPDPLTDQHKKYKDITYTHPTQVKERKKVKITTHRVLTTKHQASKTHRPFWTRIPHEHDFV